ncbi:MAG: type I restriction-modification system subunit M [Pseudomonadota bacterium]
MAIKKSELYSSLWKSCDELRGGMDASQYKDYVLSLLFIKYVSDKYADKDEPLIEIPKGGSFQDMIALKGKADIGDQINKIIANLAEENELKGVIDLTDFNDEEKLGKGKEMVDRLSKLIGIFENPALNFAQNRADGDDILGDAYEYLMRHFATESGKSKGQFYTPAEVSRILAKVIDVEKAQSASDTVYDPTCGSGSLLLKVADEAPSEMSLYGQEMDNATKALAIMNMWLHGYPSAEIWKDNTLSSPHFKNKDDTLKTFDFAVANPPFSTKSWSSGFDPANDIYERFKGYGIPPDKNGDYAFLLHIISSLKDTGKGAVILPHGVLFRGNVEAVIRQQIIRHSYIKGIIGLPANLFYGTGIPACIIVLDKEDADSREGIFMLDASQGFIKDGNKNRLREQDIHKIVDVFNKQLKVPKYARMVSYREIKENEYNLNIPRYIDSQEQEDIQDIEAHLLGGIPNKDIEDLDDYWAIYPSLKSCLLTNSDRDNYSQLKVSPENIKKTIFEHPEFLNYSQALETIFKTWETNNLQTLKNISANSQPKALIFALSEQLLGLFTNQKLIDKYDIYQHLMNYWNDTMKDDVYMLLEEGWKAELVKGGKIKKGEWDCDLVPKTLVINRYFSTEQSAIEQLEQDKDAIIRQREELEEEHNGEEGLLEEVKNDKGKVTKALLQNRIKAIKADLADEYQVLQAYFKLLDKETQANRKIKAAQTGLDKKVIAKYKELTAEEIQVLVIEDKWFNSLRQDVKTEMDSISQRLTGRIKELAERYGETLPQLDNEVAELSKKVEGHLQKMGVV